MTETAAGSGLQSREAFSPRGLHLQTFATPFWAADVNDALVDEALVVWSQVVSCTVSI